MQKFSQIQHARNVFHFDTNGFYSSGGMGVCGFAPKTLPSEAMIINRIAVHCIGESISFNKMSPTHEAIAGSKLIKMPNVLVGKRFKAIISSEYGIALDNKAMANASGKIEVLNIRSPSRAKLNGRATKVATVIPMVAAIPPCRAVPAR